MQEKIISNHPERLQTFSVEKEHKINIEYVYLGVVSSLCQTMGARIECGRCVLISNHTTLEKIKVLRIIVDAVVGRRKSMRI